MTAWAATLADGTPAWGGMTAGIVAVVLFVAFSTWIVAQRLRARDKNERMRAGRRADDD
jgi:hypothetical protein